MFKKFFVSTYANLIKADWVCFNTVFQLIILKRWNTVLAEMAQGWADDCNFDHGQPGGVTPPYDPLGQNIYVSSGSTVDIPGVVAAWFNEKVDYLYDTKVCPVGKICGHYTQVSLMCTIIVLNQPIYCA